MDQPQNILVVSDLHLGSDQGAVTSASFCHFLDWIARSGDSLEVSSLTRVDWRLARPSLIVLLGDFVDLWLAVYFKPGVGKSLMYHGFCP